MSQGMMWVFAVLIVLAMAGIAMLAAGRGEPMKPAYDDRPDALVPADREITADDLRRVRFSLAFRGYRMSEVDALLARLAHEQELRESAPPVEPGRHMATEPSARRRLRVPLRRPGTMGDNGPASPEQTSSASTDRKRGAAWRR